MAHDSSTTPSYTAGERLRRPPYSVVMKIFIDSADLDEIKRAAQLGFLDGCTTNPSLLATTGHTEVLAASLRHSLHVVQSALAGAHCATMPLKVLEQLFYHPLTESGLAKFLEDDAKVSGNAR
jgi:transaldolase